MSSSTSVLDNTSTTRKSINSYQSRLQAVDNQLRREKIKNEKLVIENERLKKTVVKYYSENISLKEKITSFEKS